MWVIRNKNSGRFYGAVGANFWWDYKETAEDVRRTNMVHPEDWEAVEAQVFVKTKDCFKEIYPKPRTEEKKEPENRNPVPRESQSIRST